MGLVWIDAVIYGLKIIFEFANLVTFSSTEERESIWIETKRNV